MLSGISPGLERSIIPGALGFVPALQADIPMVSQRRRLPYGYSLCWVKAGSPEGQHIAYTPGTSTSRMGAQTGSCLTASKTSPKAIRRNTEHPVRLVLALNCAPALHDGFHPVYIKYLVNPEQLSPGQPSAGGCCRMGLGVEGSKAQPSLSGHRSTGL